MEEEWERFQKTIQKENDVRERWHVMCRSNDRNVIYSYDL